MLRVVKLREVDGQSLGAPISPLGSRAQSQDGGITELRAPAVQTGLEEALERGKHLGISRFRSEYLHTTTDLSAVTSAFTTATSMEQAGLLKLCQSLNLTCGRFGHTMLPVLLSSPGRTISEVHAFREALDELQMNKRFRTALDSLLKVLAVADPYKRLTSEACLDLLEPGSKPPHRESKGYFSEFLFYLRGKARCGWEFDQRRKAVRRVLNSAAKLPEPSSEILKRIVGELKNLRDMPETNLIYGPVYRKGHDVVPRTEASWKSWFNGYRLGGIDVQEITMMSAVGLPMAVYSFLFGLNPGISNGVPEKMLEAVQAKGELILNRHALLGLSGMLLTLSIPIVRLSRLTRDVCPSVQRKLAASQVPNLLPLIGTLDALRSLSDRRKDLHAHGWCDPIMVPSESYSASYRGLANPCIALDPASKCVRNDLDVRGGYIKCLTGPGSGGKTTLETALVQNQILAQVGMPVAASSASITVADKIFFQGPEFFALEVEGRLGSELNAVSNIFDHATPGSIIVFDEIVGGTAHDEAVEIGRDILWALSRVKCGILMVTHDRPLVSLLVREGLAEAFQFEWQDGKSTFHLVPGMSTSSHAADIAARLKMNRAALIERLRGKGIDIESHPRLTPPETK